MRRIVRSFGLVALLGACVPATGIQSTLANLPLLQRSGGSSASAPAGYARLLSDTSYGFRFSAEGEPVRRGRRSERYELRDGDCSGGDCGQPRYRTEIREETDRSASRIGRDNWIGWSFYNANIQSQPQKTALKTVFGQWKLDGELPAAFRIVQLGRGEGHWTTCDPAVCNRSTDQSKDVVLQLDDLRAAMGWSDAQNNGYICKLFDMQANQGKWVDIVINSNFSNTSNGYLRAWVNGELACNYQGRVIATTESLMRANPNHRRGIFVSYTKRWEDAMGDTPKPTMIAYYDEFLTGTTREAVDTRLREAAGKAPKD